MFGAQKDDLPEIWRQLIEAGFETGHAYAKATAYGEKPVWVAPGAAMALATASASAWNWKSLQRHPYAAQNEVRCLRLYP